jgi:hypothetical protein
VPDIDTFTSGKKSGDCIAFFHYEQRVDPGATEREGHPVWVDIPYVRIISPGNDKEIVNRAVQEKDKQRWPERWAAFSAGEKIELDGTPIKEWPQIGKAQAATLESMKIFTVEQLSEVSDQSISTLGMGMMDLKNKARAWVEWQAGEASVQKYAQRNRRLEEKNQALENEVAALKDQLMELSAKTEQKAEKKVSAKK